MAMIPRNHSLIKQLISAFDAVNDKSSSMANVDAALDFFTVHTEIFDLIGDGSGADTAFRMRIVDRYGKVLNDLEMVRERLSKTLGLMFMTGFSIQTAPQNCVTLPSRSITFIVRIRSKTR